MLWTSLLVLILNSNLAIELNIIIGKMRNAISNDQILLELVRSFVVSRMGTSSGLRLQLAQVVLQVLGGLRTLGIGVWGGFGRNFHGSHQLLRDLLFEGLCGLWEFAGGWCCCFIEEGYCLWVYCLFLELWLLGLDLQLVINFCLYLSL